MKVFVLPSLHHTSRRCYRHRPIPLHRSVTYCFEFQNLDSKLHLYSKNWKFFLPSLHHTSRGCYRHPPIPLHRSLFVSNSKIWILNFTKSESFFLPSLHHKSRGCYRHRPIPLHRSVTCCFEYQDLDTKLQFYTKNWKFFYHPCIICLQDVVDTDQYLYIG